MKRKSNKTTPRTATAKVPIPRVGEGKRGEQGYLGYLLRQAANAQRRLMDQALGGVNLTLPQFLVLTMIRAYPGCSGADVARLAVLTPQTVHGIIANLMRRGFITRHQDPVHGRILNMELTADGLEQLSRARSRAVALDAQLLETLNEGQADIVRRWLVHVARADE
jgi:DNA-binding MarR family transcriptional regulator